MIMKQNRRDFLGSLASLTAAGLLAPAAGWASSLPAKGLHISCNEYSWITFYRRQGKEWFANPDACLREVAQSGLHGYEPSVQKPEQLTTMAPLLKKHKLEMRSVYVGCELHTEKQAAQSRQQVLAIAKAARPLGVKYIVTNPSPIRWGGPENKTDAELELQARNLDQIGAALRKEGIVLAYHNHDVEMRQGAREFHHMMVGTDPENLSLCLETHWLYRGSGNSQVALFDVLRLYGKRIATMHLRQSRNGTWSETFGQGDIDYPRLAKELLAMGLRPHIVLEQCVEKETPHTLEALAAHRQDVQEASRIFAGFRN